ncbi:MAG: DUF58 domain-containing protein, partial [Rhodospirillaceae bacterium]
SQESSWTQSPPWEAPVGRHARMILFGDFLQPLDGVATGLKTMAARGIRGHLVQILDPSEETLPFDGRIRFEGMTPTTPQVLIDRTEDIRAAYQRRLQAHRAELQDMARHAGWDFSLHHTDQPAQAALMALFAGLSDPDAARWGGG